MTEFKVEELEQLVADNPYDPKIKAQLEGAVAHQAKSGEYFFNANRQLLKLYALESKTANMDAVQTVLVMALMQMPQPHFLACKYLLPEELHSNPEVRDVFQLSSLLETAQFAKFWKEAGEKFARGALDKVQGFDAAIRTFICTVVEATYQSIDTAKLAPLLNVSEKEVATLVTARGWVKTDNGKSYSVKLSAENQFPKVDTCEKISLQDICKVLSLRA